MKSIFAVVVLALGAAPVLATDPPPRSAPTMTAAECEVWNRERSFARSVDEHDTAAFKAHLHSGTVFFGGPAGKLVGPEAVVEGWKDIIAGAPQSLHWYPRQVSIGGDPQIAHSIGPYWIEDGTSEAKSRYLVGQFISIWRKVDGEWFVLFDGGGGGRPQPATKAEVDALKASLTPECPRA